jgi:hypothetical protein
MKVMTGNLRLKIMVGFLFLPGLFGCQTSTTPSPPSSSAPSRPVILTDTQNQYPLGLHLSSAHFTGWLLGFGWVYKYSQQFESWPQGQPVKMSDCLAALKASEL